jgi:hypothetical protein
LDHKSSKTMIKASHRYFDLLLNKIDTFVNSFWIITLSGRSLAVKPGQERKFALTSLCPCFNKYSIIPNKRRNQA